MNVLAQQITIGGQKITGPLQGINNLGDVISKILPVVIAAGAVVLFFVLVWGGFSFMTSQGNAEKIKAAQARIRAGIIGFILLILSYIIVKLISSIFGLGESIF